MRQWNIVFGILLLSIIDFALAAPVPVQEKHQICVDVVHTPREVITVLEKRAVWGEEIEKLAEGHLETSEGAHSAPNSNSAPQGSEHGSVNYVQAAESNPASSTANPKPLVEPSSPLMSVSSTDTPTLTEYGSDYEYTGAHESQPNLSPWPSTDSDPNFDWHAWMSSSNPEFWHTMPSSDSDPFGSPDLEHQPALRPAPPTESGLAHGYQLDDGQQSNPGSPPQEIGVANEYQVNQGHSSPRPLTDPDPNLNFDWHRWMTSEDRPVSRPASPTENGVAHVDGGLSSPGVSSPGLSGPRPSDSDSGSDSDSDADYWFGSAK